MQAGVFATFGYGNDSESTNDAMHGARMSVSPAQSSFVLDQTLVDRLERPIGQRPTRRATTYKFVLGNQLRVFFFTNWAGDRSICLLLTDSQAHQL